jgi:uncharacterized protein YprB with RNaseH-like and TPR domain
MTNPKTLVLDIETWPIIAAVFGLKDQFIGLNQIRTDWSLMAYGAKWFGEKEVFYQDTHLQKDLRDDSKLLKNVWKLLDEADIVITQNGQSFDGPKLNARFMLHKMTPPSPYRHLDTYRIAKRVAEFTSNKLEYLTDKLCTKFKKVLHPKFSGMVLWNECEKGNLDAWKEMKFYNIHDVLSTEELYTKLKAWAPETMPTPHVESHKVGKCGACGVFSLIRSGKRIDRLGVYQRYQCTKCGRWIKGERIK